MAVKHVIESVMSLFTGSYSGGRTASVPATLPTGFRALDKAVGIGGLPCGKITEIMGSPGAAAIAARIGSKAQRSQQLVTIVDMSRAFDPWLAERAGLVAPQLLLRRPETVFEALTLLEEAGRQSGLVIIVMGVVAELLAQAGPDLLQTLLRRLRIIVRHSDSVFLFVTAPRSDDPFSPANYPAGFPLAELADIRLWIQDENWSYKGGAASSYKANLTVIKNRLALVGPGADIRLRFSPLKIDSSYVIPNEAKESP